MNTYQFSFKGRKRFIDARNIFEAMVEFHAHFAESLEDSLEELHISQLM